MTLQMLALHTAGVKFMRAPYLWLHAMPQVDIDRVHAIHRDECDRTVMLTL